MCQSEGPFPGTLGSAATPGYAVGSDATAKEGKDPLIGYVHTFEQSLRRRRAELQSRHARVGQKIQLLTELLRVFEED